MQLVCWVLRIYLVVLAARAVLSWFPVRPGSPLTSVVSLLADLTEPVLRPFRSIIPPVGMFDLSFMVVFFVLEMIDKHSRRKQMRLPLDKTRSAR